jgi:hypothetical protein
MKDEVVVLDNNKDNADWIKSVRKNKNKKGTLKK